MDLSELEFGLDEMSLDNINESLPDSNNELSDFNLDFNMNGGGESPEKKLPGEELLDLPPIDNPSTQEPTGQTSPSIQVELIDDKALSNTPPEIMNTLPKVDDTGNLIKEKDISLLPFPEKQTPKPILDNLDNLDDIPNELLTNKTEEDPLPDKMMDVILNVDEGEVGGPILVEKDTLDSHESIDTHTFLEELTQEMIKETEDHNKKVNKYKKLEENNYMNSSEYKKYVSSLNTALSGISKNSIVKMGEGGEFLITDMEIINLSSKM